MLQPKGTSHTNSDLEMLNPDFYLPKFDVETMYSLLKICGKFTRALLAYQFFAFENRFEFMKWQPK
jgi:hypothetical protein